MSLLDRLLPEPDFVTRDPATLTRDLIQDYENRSGKTLYPAQVERVLIDLIAYRESLVREAIQDAAKLNLVRYSRAPILDYLGENIGVARLPAVAARTTLRFYFDPAPLSSTLLPAGTQVEVADLAFATLTPITVAPNATSVEVEAACTSAGTSGNGFVAGQIKTLSQPVPGLNIRRVENLNTSSGGAAAEDDEHLRERIVLAPEQFSNAGSIGAYRFHALSAHPEVIDVAVVSPSPGVVNLHPLSKNGLPANAIKNAVLATCNGEQIRPLTDQVQVLDPVAVPYTLRAQLTLFNTADSALAQSQALAAAYAYRDRLQARLGLDIVRSQIIDALHVYGVYAVNLLEPARDSVLSAEQWPSCRAVEITLADSVVG